MAEQEELLQRANTPLIESRALQHTVNSDKVETKAQESLALSQEAQASAEAALKELDTRRLAMIIALGVIVVTILALVLIKLELDRDLESKRTRTRFHSLSLLTSCPLFSVAPPWRLICRSRLSGRFSTRIPL